MSTMNDDEAFSAPDLSAWLMVGALRALTDGYCASRRWPYAVGRSTWARPP
jgi:hypothetical protein